MILRIRCKRDTYVRFKKVAAEFKDYEDALIKLISIAELYPDLLKRREL